MELKHVVFFSLVFALISLATPIKRNWLMNTNYNNTNNWNTNRLPCVNDRVIFQSSLGFAVSLPEGETQIGELVLPSSGEIVMPMNGKLYVSGGKTLSKSCKGEDAVYKRREPAKWVDFANWDGWNSATPHLERIPCSNDYVIFPKKSSFSVLMPQKTIQISGLEINGMELDTTGWEEFVSVNNEIGNRQFFKHDKNPGSLEVLEHACTDQAGCYCRNEYLENEVCDLVKPTCPNAYCFSPVQPIGHCCEICAAVLMLGFNDKFKLSDLKSEMYSLPLWKEHDVASHISRIGDYIQIVLLDRGDYTGEISIVANKLQQALLSSNLHLELHTLTASGHVYYPPSFTSFITRFILTFFAALVVLLVIVVYYYNNSWSSLMTQIRSGTKFRNETRPFVFARFENQTGELELRNNEDDENETMPVSQKAFDNPMYGTTAQSSCQITHGNPIYSELKKTEDEEEILPIESGSEASKDSILISQPEE